jgi:AcrR family transcriptional regulator
VVRLPRAGLSTDKVVAEAAALADELGYDKLTLAAVAERLGVRLPSLYKHVASLDALRQGVAALATRELAEAITAAAVGRAGGEALRAIADAYRGYGRAHPGRYAATVRAPGPADADHSTAAEAVLRVVFAVLGGYHITGEDAIDATRALRAALHGFITLEAAGGFGIPRDIDRSYDRFVTAFAAALANWSRQPAAPDATG